MYYKCILLNSCVLSNILSITLQEYIQSIFPPDIMHMLLVNYF